MVGGESQMKIVISETETYTINLEEEIEFSRLNFIIERLRQVAKLISFDDAYKQARGKLKSNGDGKLKPLLSIMRNPEHAQQLLQVWSENKGLSNKTLVYEWLALNNYKVGTPVTVRNTVQKIRTNMSIVKKDDEVTEMLEG